MKAVEILCLTSASVIISQAPAKHFSTMSNPSKRLHTMVRDCNMPYTLLPPCFHASSSSSLPAPFVFFPPRSCPFRRPLTTFSPPLSPTFSPPLPLSLSDMALVNKQPETSSQVFSSSTTSTDTCPRSPAAPHSPSSKSRLRILPPFSLLPHFKVAWPRRD